MSLVQRLAARVRPATATPAASSQPLTPFTASSTPIQADPYPLIPDNYMIGLVEGEDKTPERERIGVDGYTHVSSLMGICTRQHVIAALYGVKLLRPVTGADRVVWALGRAAEKHWRTQFISARRRRGIWGVWKCLCGAAEHHGLHKTGIVCTRCQTQADHFHEPTLRDHANHVTGHPDLPFFFGKFMVVNEIKSMEGEAFNDLKEPKGDHVHQALMYRRMVRLQYQNLFPVHKQVIVTYISKKYNRERRRGSTETWRPYKEFKIDGSTPEREAQVDASLADAAEIKAGRASRNLPPRTACANSTCSRAKDCPVAHLCFGL